MTQFPANVTSFFFKSFFLCNIELHGIFFKLWFIFWDGFGPCLFVNKPVILPVVNFDRNIDHIF